MTHLYVGFVGGIFKSRSILRGTSSSLSCCSAWPKPSSRGVGKVVCEELLFSVGIKICHLLFDTCFYFVVGRLVSG